MFRKLRRRSAYHPTQPLNFAFAKVGFGLWAGSSARGACFSIASLSKQALRRRDCDLLADLRSHGAPARPLATPLGDLSIDPQIRRINLVRRYGIDVAEPDFLAAENARPLDARDVRLALRDPDPRSEET
jgi:hypothetical protein